MSDQDEMDRENAIWRIKEDGPGAELVRRHALQRLVPLIKPFCSHASLADIVFLCNALEWVNRPTSSRVKASLVESVLTLLGIDPASILSRLDSDESEAFSGQICHSETKRNLAPRANARR